MQRQMNGGPAMAREIQPQANRARGAGVKAFLGLLANAIFWLVIAIVFPEEVLRQLVPELAESVEWLPLVFYGLALWSLVRAVRSLRGLNLSTPRRAVTSARLEGGRREGAKRADPGRATPPVSRQPTVQRMR